MIKEHKWRMIRFDREDALSRSRINGWLMSNHTTKTIVEAVVKAIDVAHDGSAELKIGTVY